VTISFDGVLFFPVTPFDAAGEVELGVFREHVSTRLEHGPGAVFPACGTGEFHALTVAEALSVTRAAVEVTAGRVPVVAGAVPSGRRASWPAARRRPGPTRSCCCRRTSWADRSPA
jgi:dihydrodipicolinate synthase/N-acetylneuraminate lyase